MSFYQPAHSAHTTKHNNQVYEFDSPSTIAKQQHGFQPQPFVQAGGAPSSFSSAPAPPPLPQLGYKSARPLSLKTRDWNSQPWKGNSDSYKPPVSQLWNSNSSSRIPIHHPSNLPPFAHNELPATGPSPSSHHSGLPVPNYQPLSTIPISHNRHLPSSGLARSTSASDISVPSLQKNDTWNQSSWGPSSSSNIPSAPAWNGFKYGTWRQNRNRSLKPINLRTRSWGNRSEQGWSGFNSQNILGESFLKNRPFYNAKQAPRLPSFLSHQRKWKSGPYKQRPLRTHNWGQRGENGWSNFNSSLYANESALPFMANRQRFFSEEPITRQLPLESSSSTFQQQSFAPIQQSFAPIQQQSFIPTPIAAAPIAAAPLAAAPFPALEGRKGRRAARKMAKQQAIAQKLTTELNPPIGDPAINHYRRGAKATVPLAGPAIAGVAPPTGSLGSRRVGKKNTLGSRRGRTAAQGALPIPATQPQLASGVVRPVVAPLSANSSAFTPLAATSNVPSFNRAAALPLGGYPASTIPLTSTIPITSAPIQSTFLEKQYQAPIVNVRPTGSGAF